MRNRRSEESSRASIRQFYYVKLEEISSGGGQNKASMRLLNSGLKSHSEVFRWRFSRISLWKKLLLLRDKDTHAQSKEEMFESLKGLHDRCNTGLWLTLSMR